LLLYELLFEIFSEAFVALLLADRPFVYRHIFSSVFSHGFTHFPPLPILYIG
jgi:hypothetical protein